MLFLVSVMQVFSIKAQPISGHFFGQNAWMPDSIGNVKKYGQLDSKWPEIKASGAQIIRFGGISADKNKPTNYQYIKMIDKIRAQGMEPVMQVPFHNGQYSAAEAAAIVKYVNITMGRAVKYWVIGNEPDLEYQYTSAGQVSWYLKQFASAMKAQDPTIKTIGPETAWYNTNIINGLTTPGGPDDVTGKDANGRYYIDIISFHMYSFNGTQTRSQVLTDLTSPNRFDYNLGQLNSRIATCNSTHGRSGTNALKVAVTEANVGFVNPSTDNLWGTGANSFVGGQFWAELLAIGMKRGVDFINFWSVVEGNNNQYNIGYVDYVTGAKKPVFYHFQMVAQNFNGTYLNGTDNQANVKAFGARNNAGQTVVMILNQDQGTNFNYTVRLDGNTASGTNPLKINVNSGIAKEYTGSINNQATQVLVFDGSGNIVKKIDYKLSGNADANLPPTVTNISGTSSGTLTATITPSGATAICSGSSVVLKANTGTGYTYQWKKDGVNITGATAANYTATTAGSYQVKITSGTQNAWSAPLAITTGTAPAATITPGGPLTIATGGGVNLQANTGTGLTYVWMKNNVAISGATSSLYRATTAGTYTVIVKNSTGCTKTSAAVTVNVSGTFAATITPAGATAICSGSSVVLKANTGTGYIYQWKKNGVNITGATAANYTATTAGSYQVKITSGSQVAWSAPLSITTGTTPVATITAGGPLTFASGGGVNLQANTGTGLTYQWKKNNVDIAGATASAYRATTAGVYTVVVKNTTGCTKASAGVTVSVTGGTFAATVTPSGTATICSGSSVLLKANTGSGFTYQWKKDGVAITGATSSTYAAKAAGSYQVKIVSGTQTAWSAPVTVTVAPMPAISITASGSTTVGAGGYVNLSATTGTGFAYQWKKNGANISGATASTYKATSTGTYTCYVTRNGACGVQSNSVAVNVGSTFAASIAASGPTSVAVGGNVWLKANTGTGITYQWKRNGYAISGATGSSYNATQSGTYTVTETYGFTTTTSNAVTVTVGSTLYAMISAGGPTTFPSGGKVVLYANTGSSYIYQWKKNGVNITGATGPTYTATTAGSYQVKITMGTLNAWSAPLTITVSGATARMADTSGASGGEVTAMNSDQMQVEGAEVLENRTYQFANPNDSSVISNDNGNTLGAGGRKGTDVGRAGAPALNKTGAGGRKSSSTARVDQTAEMDSTELSKMINHETGSLSLKAYPNPTEGDLTITVTTVNTVQTQVKLELYNTLGQIVWTKSPLIENGFMNDVIQLDGSVAAGDYFLRVREDQSTEIMKICVIK